MRGSSQPAVVCFGNFEVDLQAAELRKDGQRVRLQEQPFRVLALLLRNPGQSVTREELRQNLWPADTFVDFDHGLNSAVARLREALGDAAEKPRYVETVAKRGYRFIGTVSSTEPLAVSSGPFSAKFRTAFALVRRSVWVGALALDEKAFRKGHKYFTLVNDLERSRVLYVGEDRTQASLDGFWGTLSKTQRDSIAAIAMDMWDPYVASVTENVQDGGKKIVYDKFHIAKHLGDAVDKVRRKENRTLRAAGDDRLTGTRYDWLRNPAAMEPADRRAFTELRRSGLKTARAWALKETAMALFSYQYERPARKHFRWWHGWAVRSRLRPMLEVARTLKRRFENIITYLRHQVTNAASESINAKIQWVKYTARGFRNKENFKAAILFHCGGLDLAP